MSKYYRLYWIYYRNSGWIVKCPVLCDFSGGSSKINVQESFHMASVTGSEASI